MEITMNKFRVLLYCLILGLFSINSTAGQMQPKHIACNSISFIGVSTIINRNKYQSAKHMIDAGRYKNMDVRISNATSINIEVIQHHIILVINAAFITKKSTQQFQQEAFQTCLRIL